MLRFDTSRTSIAVGLQWSTREIGELPSKIRRRNDHYGMKILSFRSRSVYLLERFRVHHERAYYPFHIELQVRVQYNVLCDTRYYTRYTCATDTWQVRAPSK
jgi:hypothetical protein